MPPEAAGYVAEFLAAGDAIKIDKGASKKVDSSDEFACRIVICETPGLSDSARQFFLRQISYGDADDELEACLERRRIIMDVLSLLSKLEDGFVICTFSYCEYQAGILLA